MRGRQGKPTARVSGAQRWRHKSQPVFTGIAAIIEQGALEHNWQRRAIGSDGGKSRISSKQKGCGQFSPAGLSHAQLIPVTDRRQPNPLAAAENQPRGKGQVIVGDITYLPLLNGQ